MNVPPRSLTIFLTLFMLTSMVITGCTAANSAGSKPSSPTQTETETENPSAAVCPVTEPLWLKPPEDAAVQGSPDFGYYFANQDQSILASAWWAEQEDYHLEAGEEGFKIGWFRPAGAELAITGRRLDGQAPPLEASVPCCYPTRFQAGGLRFPTEGCWEVTARAAGSELTFVIQIDP